MNGSNNPPSPIEQFPTEIFQQIFEFISLQDIAGAFFGLNSHLDTIVRSVSRTSHVIRCDNIDAINLLHSFHLQIAQLIVVNAEKVDFTSLMNLRLLTLKYGTPMQLDSIRPLYFPMLEILNVTGNAGSSFLSGYFVKHEMTHNDSRNENRHVGVIELSKLTLQ
jgi:hypothetical protein